MKKEVKEKTSTIDKSKFATMTEIAALMFPNSEVKWHPSVRYFVKKLEKFIWCDKTKKDNFFFNYSSWKAMRINKKAVKELVELKKLYKKDVLKIDFVRRINKLKEKGLI